MERYLNKIDDMETISRIEKYMRRVLSETKSTSPIQFTQEQANVEINIAEQELKEGKGINEEEMRQFFETWRNKLR